MKNTLYIGIGQIVAQLLMVGSITAFVGIVFTTLPRVDRYLILKATQDCANTYRLQFTDKSGSTTISRPIDDLYRKCLTEKGL